MSNSAAELDSNYTDPDSFREKVYCLLIKKKMSHAQTILKTPCYYTTLHGLIADHIHTLILANDNEKK